MGSPFFCFSICDNFLLTRYLLHHWRDFHKILWKCPLWHVPELIKFWRSKVKGQGHHGRLCRKNVTCSTIAHKPLQGFSPNFMKVSNVSCTFKFWRSEVKGQGCHGRLCWTIVTCQITQKTFLHYCCHYLCRNHSPIHVLMVDP